MTKLEEIKKSIEALEDSIDGYAVDFAREYYDIDISYIEDAFHDFADNNTSIYYSDQRDYYYENQAECEEALDEYGYDLNELFKECGSLDAVICKAGAIGEYKSIYDELCYYQEEIETLMELYNERDEIEEGGEE